eukprot:989245-Rhodomonas_salina.1
MPARNQSGIAALQYKVYGARGKKELISPRGEPLGARRNARSRAHNAGSTIRCLSTAHRVAPYAMSVLRDQTGRSSLRYAYRTGRRVAPDDPSRLQTPPPVPPGSTIRSLSTAHRVVPYISAVLHTA